MQNKHENPDRAEVDFETRSACSLPDCGSWRYSLDPTTEVLCMAFRLPYWESGRVGLWHPAFPHLGIEEGGTGFDDLEEFFAWTMAGGLVEAHNAWFERGIWVNKMEPQGWPAIRPEQWRCSAAKAASHALPRALENAVDALRLDVPKDMEGHRLMKKMAVPKKPTKADKIAWKRQHIPCITCDGSGKVQEFKKDGTPKAKLSKCPACKGGGYRELDEHLVPPMPLLWHESKELMFQLFAYCCQDILAEAAVSARLIDLHGREGFIYMMDQIVNERGFMLDTEAVDVALELVDIECVDLNRELFALTDGAVERATQRQRMLAWLSEQGCDLDDTRKETIEDTLSGKARAPWLQEITPKVRRGLELMKILGRSSTSKYVAMKDWVCPDSRVHGGLLYHGASTGRWTGAGVQPHNFVKGRIHDMEKAWEIIKTKDRERIVTDITDKKGKPIGTVMDVLAEALRGAIIPTPGNQLYVADFASIEARVLLWIADDVEALEVFHRGEDIYCYMATDIYGYPTNKHDHPKERGIGKIAVLGLGYQMGWRKFQATAALGGVELDDDFCQHIVTTYREKFWRVKKLWHDIEDAAINAVEHPDRIIYCGKVAFSFEDDFLYCMLPSGRCLAYSEPEIRWKPIPWDENDLRPQLTFMGVNPMNHRWQRQSTYGGSLVENVVQAVSRDLMAEAMWRCEQHPVYMPVLSVHDELIAEAKLGAGDVKEFEQLMAALPAWAEGCPVEAEGWRGLRYRK